MRYVKKNPSLNELVILASEGFRQPITPALELDVKIHLEDTDFCVCIYDEEALVACMLCKLPIPGVLYIAGTLVRSPYQGRGIKAEATRAIFDEDPNLVWFAGRTQSPIVWSSVRRIARELLPHPDPDQGSDQMHRLRAELAQSLGMSDVIVPGFYGGALYGVKPINHDPQVQSWWDSICTFERGDAVLYMARY